VAFHALRFAAPIQEVGMRLTGAEVARKVKFSRKLRKSDFLEKYLD
jgi:hypothetical protein